LIGADKVIVFAPALRETEPKPGSKYQPPATEVHVDYTTPVAHGLASHLLSQSDEPDLKYSRFVCINLWRALSPPPQDWPLAVCDGRSVAFEDGIPNEMLIVDELPDVSNLEPLPEDPARPAALVFEYRSDFRWYYFSRMENDELLCFKLFDSDQNATCRCPHTAFHHETEPDRVPRKSLEIRTVAYFK